MEDEIGRLKSLFGILSGRWNMKNDKFERFHTVIGFCMAIHNLKRFYDGLGIRKERTPAWTPDCASPVRPSRVVYNDCVECRVLASCSAECRRRAWTPLPCLL